MKRGVVLALLLAAIPAVSAGQDSLEAAKRSELDAIRRQAQEKRQAAQRLLGQETREISLLRRTDRRLNETRRRLRALDQRKRSLGQELEHTKVSLVRSQTALRIQKDRLALRLRNLYKYGGERSLEFLLSTQSFAQLLARWDFLVMVAEQDRMVVEDVSAKQAVVQENQQLLQGRLTEVAKTAVKTNRETDRLAELRQEKASTVRSIQSRRQNYEAAAAELERTARSMQKLLASLELRRRAESDRARNEGRSPQPYTGDFARGEGRLEWPVRGDIIGHFGPETHPKWGTVTMNNGVDIAVPMGTAVRVVARGRVDYTSEDFGAYGEMVVVNHGDGYYTLYGHLSSISVSVGAELTAGQTVGLSGDTGSLKGPILHFEVRKGSASLNPEEWLH